MKTFLFALILLSAVLLDGCASDPCKPTVVFQKVEVPVAVLPPAPPKVEEKPLPVDSLPLTASDKDTAQAYWDSVQILKNEVDQFKAIIDAYTNYKLPTNTPPQGNNK